MDSVMEFNILRHRRSAAHAVSGWLLGTLLAFTTAPIAAEEDLHNEDRRQLIALMAEVEGAINAQSAERLTARMADDVTVTWLNAEVSRGKNEVKEYYNRMVGGEGTILSKYLTKVSLAAPARFFGDIALAEGIAADEFFPHARSPFHLDSRWSATLRKADDQWQIATLHLSTNVFTNPLMAEAQDWVRYAGIGGLFAGGLFMFLLMRLRRKSLVNRSN